MSQDLRTQPFKPCITLPINTGCVNPLAVQEVLTPLNARRCNQLRFVPYQKSDLCMRIHELAHTFRAQPLMCIPACLDPSPVTGYLTCSTSMPRSNATTCLLHDTLQICASYNRWQPPKASCQSILLTVLFSDVSSLCWDHCPLYWMLRKNYRYLIHEAGAVVHTAFLHSLNKSVIIWLQYDLHITLLPCHFTRWIGNLRTSQEKTLLISTQCSFPEH